MKKKETRLKAQEIKEKEKKRIKAHLIKRSP